MGESNFSNRPDRVTQTPIDVTSMTVPAPKKAAPNSGAKTVPLSFAIVALVLVLVLCAGTMLFSYLIAGVVADNKAAEAMASFTPTSELTVIHENTSVLENTGYTYTEEDRVIAVSRAEQSVVSVHLYTEKSLGQTRPDAYYSAGSGVVWSGQSTTNPNTTFSYIVTNYHVIESFVNGVSSYITVTTSSPTEQVYEATLVGGDLFSDLALLRVSTALPQAEKSSNAQISKGMSCIAIGNPLGIYGGSVTDGAISALARDITLEGITQTLLQFDAAVNSGNSGGGLFDYNGRLLGIVNAKTMGEGVEGLGFAIPIDTVKAIVSQLITQGYVSGRPLFGVTLLEISQDTNLTGIDDAFPGIGDCILAMANTSIGEYGLYVTASNHASLQYGDYLYKVNGEIISDMTDIRRLLSLSEVGDVWQCEVKRLAYGSSTPQSVVVHITLTERTAA